ncbi:MAG: DUF1553 domain-containing protein [Planctomycetes bacterium]|nr:DUF1553 domain-containing protein [Planctomycetota bacterium]
MKRSVVMAALLAASVWLPSFGAERPSRKAVSFIRDIRPILTQKCFQCHGPDAKSRKARLRLDERTAALADRGCYAAIVPGKAAASAVMARILSENTHEKMPPARLEKPLAKHEIELLRDWIDQGALYQKHWAFEPLAKPPVPKLKEFPNAIDGFVAANLHEHGLRLAPEAATETLLRRVTLDLTGLPPTPTELDAFRADLGKSGADGNACYERVVDRLLRSQHFGEHMAVSWLDAARYADSNGYFSDRPRQMWLWRDWVIDAFNANMPFDRFTIEQLAGDLLPKPTVRQRIATGFNRNNMANNETGIIDEEFRVEYVVDRVHTTMTVWQGLTAGCAQCHDHKFDPISQREFYQLFAFFNNVPETGLIVADNPPPLIEVPSEKQQQRLAELTASARAAAEAFAPVHGKLSAAIATWERDAPRTLPRPPEQALVLHEAFDGRIRRESVSRGTTLSFDRGVRGQSAKFDATQHVEAPLPSFHPDRAWTIGMWLLPDGSLSSPLSLIEPTGNRRGIEMIWAKGLLKIHLVHRWGVRLIEASTTRPMNARQWHHVVVSYDGSHRAKGLRVFVDGLPAKIDIRSDTLEGTLVNAQPLRIGRRDDGLGFYGRIDEVRIVQQALDEKAISDWFWGERIRGILERDKASRDSHDADRLLDYYVPRFADAAAQAARQRVQAATRALNEARAAIPTALVMQEMAKPRITRVLERGEYDKPGEVVRAGVPSAIAPWLQSTPRNRLGLARWLVSADNPLTARVAVNRFWQQIFGEGLVRTVDDFGAQGELPTHPDLLDWLAASFRDSGWNVKELKELIRLMVTSRTYRQRSHHTVKDGQVFDPDNRLLARGPSCRLSAEMLRDQALAVSGLLVPKIGGPSVKPYQPPGLWEAVSYNAEDSYVPDTGAGLWRRSLYTYIKRQAPPPALLTFDGPTREKCTMRRARTNTPLQALLLLNDQTFTEAARALGVRTLNTPAGDDARLQRLWRTVLVRPAQAPELDLLKGLLHRQRARFAADLKAAQHLLAVGAARINTRHDPRELAAWTVVAHTLLNLDEAITKR